METQMLVRGAQFARLLRWTSEQS